MEGSTEDLDGWKAEMEFRLLYQGRVPSNGGPGVKHEIRKIFHAQLRQLWMTNHDLREQALFRAIQNVPLQPGDLPSWVTDEAQRVQVGFDKIASNWSRNGYSFLPLLRKQNHARCAVEVLFLRPGNSLSVLLKGGDLDNRAKTLFDALRMPESAQELANQTPADGEQPFFVLLENDILVSEIRITADQLLTLPDGSPVQPDQALVVVNVRILRPGVGL